MAGRIRFKIPALRRNAKASGVFEGPLQGMNGIKWTEVNTRCASLIVRFDHRLVGQEEIVGRVREIAKSKEKDLVAAKPRGGRRPARAESKNGKSGNSLKAAMARFVALTLISAIVFVREVMLKRPWRKAFSVRWGSSRHCSPCPWSKEVSKS